jgi:hypothetical protein
MGRSTEDQKGGEKKEKRAAIDRTPILVIIIWLCSEDQELNLPGLEHYPD